MGPWPYIGVIVISAGALVAVTGWWRLAFAAFRIPAGRMAAGRLGLLFSSPDEIARVDTILQSFAGGFNTMISRPSASAWARYCEARSPLYRPFAHEGVAMGFTLRRLFRYSPEVFEEQIVRPRPEFRYLYYVGLGFWSGMRDHGPDRLARIVDGLDPLHRYLCYDGYGFKYAFFDYRKSPASMSPLDRLEGYARNAAYQGAGRAFWFLFAGCPEVLIEQVNRFGPHAPDLAAGVGLAAVFVYPDQLERARTLGLVWPQECHPHFHLGMCFGLKARSINDRDQFEQDVARADPLVQKAVHASVRACDRVELQVRSEGGEDGYRRWRARVTDWMAEHIEYPLARVKPAVPLRVGPEGALHPQGEEAMR